MNEHQQPNRVFYLDDLGVDEGGEEGNRENTNATTATQCHGDNIQWQLFAETKVVRTIVRYGRGAGGARNQRGAVPLFLFSYTGHNSCSVEYLEDGARDHSLSV